MKRIWLLVGAAAVILLMRIDLGAAETAVIGQYCLSCHNDRVRTAGLALDRLNPNNVGEEDRAEWEKIVQKLRTRAMPPLGNPRPDEASYNSLVQYLETALDRVAAEHPNPGRRMTFRRLNASEYQNAVRDLLALDIDATSLLPKEDASHGFDSVNVGGLSPTLLERYLIAAQKVSRLAIGSPLASPGSFVVDLPVELTQEDHFDGMPLGTRGGTVVHYNFPLDGQYDIQVRLQRNRNENVEGLTEPTRMDLTIAGEAVASFTIAPNRNQDGIYYSDEDVDKHLHARVAVKAGPREVAVVFFRKTSALLQTDRQPYLARFNMNRHPRTTPAIYSVSIAGPFNPAGPGDTPSRRRIFTCHPNATAKETECARQIISTLARRAYRRPLSDADVNALLAFFKQGEAEGGFEDGIEMALRAMLTSTDFLFRIEKQPRNVQPNTVYRISDLEMASRLSFFLWSSIPDDELLDLAISKSSANLT